MLRAARITEATCTSSLKNERAGGPLLEVLAVTDSDAELVSGMDGAIASFVEYLHALAWRYRLAVPRQVIESTLTFTTSVVCWPSAVSKNWRSTAMVRPALGRTV